MKKEPTFPITHHEYENSYFQDYVFLLSETIRRLSTLNEAKHLIPLLHDPSLLSRIKEISEIDSSRNSEDLLREHVALCFYKITDRNTILPALTIISTGLLAPYLVWNQDSFDLSIKLILTSISSVIAIKTLIRHLINEYIESSPEFHQFQNQAYKVISQYS